MKNKRGLSTIVVTLIIILLSLVAIEISWVVVRNIIEKNAERITIQNQFFGDRIDITSVNVYSPLVNISLRKLSGEIKTEKVNVSGVSISHVDVDIVSAVDLSGSMIECYGISRNCCTSLGGSYSSPNCSSLTVNKKNGCISCGGTWGDKLTPLQDANKDMINTLLGKGSRMGLVAYRDSIINSGSSNLIDNIPVLNATIDTWTATSTTCICCGINNASDRLMLRSNLNKSKAIIIMSDGEANVKCSRQNTGNAKQDAIHAACDANRTLGNVTIWSIGVGDADTATLTSIAECGGGRYFSVANANELIQIYQSIAQEIITRYQKVEYLNYLSVIFYNETDSYKEIIGEIPDMLETNNYNFNLQGSLSGKITKIEIYPVIISQSKEEIIGPLLAVWKAD